MDQNRHGINILMYHSISEGAGPTCLPPEIFRAQIAALADAGYTTVRLTDVVAWMRCERTLPGRSMVLTFDDGFDDFATAAFPELDARGWTATVFLPAGKIGGTSDWENRRNGLAARPLMSWETAAELARYGIDLGAHGVTHSDLTTLPPEAARAEICNSKRIIEDQTGCSVTSFSSPYGKTNAMLRLEVTRRYRVAVGTGLARASLTSDVYDLPRIEMWYFRNLRRWRAYLEGGCTGYVWVRRALSAVRSWVKRSPAAPRQRYE